MGKTEFPNNGKKNWGQPNPQKFILNNIKPSSPQECFDTQGRNANRGGPEKVSLIIKRRQQGNSEAAIGKGIENSVWSGDSWKIERIKEPAFWNEAVFSEENRRNEKAQQQGEEQRMEKTSVSPKAAVGNAEFKG